MISDLEDNKFKISIPIITDEELKRFDYKLETDLDNIVNVISTHISRDREIILLKKVIEKQQKEIEDLKEKIGDEKYFLQFGEIIEKKRWKDKIKAKIEEVKDGTFDAEIILHQLLEKE